MKLKERLKAKNSKLGKKAQKFGVTLGVIGGAITPLNPLVGGIIIAGGTIVTALGQLTTDEDEQK